MKPKRGYCQHPSCNGNHIYMDEKKGEVLVCLGPPKK